MSTTCGGGNDSPTSDYNQMQNEKLHTSRQDSYVSSNSDGGDIEKSLKITSAKDWTGPDDAGNAQNWPLWQKIYHTSTVAGIALVASFASSAYTPGLRAVSEEFGVSMEVATTGFAVYVLGMGLGAPFASPISEAVGRKYVYLTCIPIFALFILGTGFAQSAAALCVTRFFAGFFSSPALSIGSALLSDIWPPRVRSLPMSVYVAAPFLGPTLGPLLGGFVTTRMSWRWNSWLILFFVAVFLPPALFMKETYKRTILARRARDLQVEGPPAFKQDNSWRKTILKFVRSGLTRPLHMLFTEPVVTAFTFYTGFNFALLYSFFAAFPWVFEHYYAFTLEQTGLTFIGTGVGCTVGLGIILAVDRFVYQPRVRAAKDEPPVAGATSKVAPEQRLYLSQIGGPCITVGLFIFGWTAFEPTHWIGPVVGEALFGCGNLLVFMSATLYVMDTYGPLYGASAMAANTLVRYILATIFPLFAVQMFRGMGVQWACTMLALVSLLACAVPFGFWAFGERMRARSKYRHGN